MPEGFEPLTFDESLRVEGQHICHIWQLENENGETTNSVAIGVIDYPPSRSRVWARYEDSDDLHSHNCQYVDYNRLWCFVRDVRCPSDMYKHIDEDLDALINNTGPNTVVCSSHDSDEQPSDDDSD